ncbi:MAG: hypothetical protein RJA34_1323, partial [Pseudomonadota bacterium]
MKVQRGLATYKGVMFIKGALMSEPIRTNIM